MNPVQEHELSGLLDNQLDEHRAAEVRAAVAADPNLREKLAALTLIDAQLRQVAERASFAPAIRLPTMAPRPATDWHWGAAAAVVLTLLVVRLLPKLFDLALLGVALQLAGIVLISFVVIRMAELDGGVSVRGPARSA